MGNLKMEGDVMTTKTINQLHFDDLDPIRFEELILSMVYRMRRWEKLDHFGKKGSDDGIDIRAVEKLENGKENVWHFQCKRYQRLTNSQIKNIINDYIAKNKFLPDYYILVVSCSLSKKQIEFYEEFCKENGFKSVTVWTNSIIEAKLYSEYQDLLFAYFGINLTTERNKIQNTIRRNIALKKRMKKDFLKQGGCRNRDEVRERLDNPWKKFNHTEVLIRSIYDKAYPYDNTLLNNDYSGYYKAEVFDFYHNGLMVRAYPYAEDIKYKQLNYETDEYEIIDIRAEILGCIPYENIIDYDIEGDEYYNYPHIFCEFINVTDPYEKLTYITPDNFPLDDDCIIR